ncbi:MAG: hypothetical protein KF862_07085 [Chitinophagaceae bacterium]|nr:hypothetical protein [Chitinophagaceae bacterium]
MNTLPAKEFISIYQYAIFRQVRIIYGSLVPGEDFGKTIIRFNENLLKPRDKSSLFSFMLHCTNLGKVIQVLSNFKFLSDVVEDDRFILFGQDSNYNLYIGVEKSTGKIVLLDEEQNTFSYIAKDELHFLEYLKTHIEYTFFSGKAGSLQYLTDWVRKQVIKDIGGDEYKNYYTFIFPTEEESREYRILELPNQIR